MTVASISAILLSLVFVPSQQETIFPGRRVALFLQQPTETANSLPLEHITVIPFRAQTQIVRSGVCRTNS